MSRSMTSSDIPSATSSPASAGGPSPHVWRDGQTIDLFGQAPAPASRSRSRGRAPAKVMSDTSGLCSSVLSIPIAPLSLWESKLRQRLSSAGSMELSAIWKERVTPAGRRFFQRVPRMRPIDVTGSGSLPTPSGTSNHGKNHVSGRIDEWGGSSNYFRGKPGGNEHLPGFELWTMGFPDEWRQLMPPAMPSSRKSRRKSSAPI